MWFDSWKSLSIWSTVSNAAPLELHHDDKEVVDSSEGALLLSGPVLGAPRTVEAQQQVQLIVPILIELDRKVTRAFLSYCSVLLKDDIGLFCQVTVELFVSSLFTSHSFSISFDVPFIRPFVFDIGPLEVCRSLF